MKPTFDQLRQDVLDSRSRALEQCGYVPPLVVYYSTEAELRLIEKLKREINEIVPCQRVDTRHDLLF